ncbi:MAG: ankyrin repeat domain-containing protein [Emcibacteraceae bacterium]
MRDDVFKAIDIADADALRKILEKDSSLASARSNDGLSAVLFTLYIRKPELTDILLEYKPELDQFDLAALGGVGQLSALIATNNKLVHEYSGDGFTALHIASYFGQAECARLLLENGADIDKVAMNGSDLRAIHSAVAGCHTDVVKVLIEFEPDIDVQMFSGFTPLMSAAALGNKEIVSILLEKNADPKIKADDGRIAESFARSAGYCELADLISS